MSWLVEADFGSGYIDITSKTTGHLKRWQKLHNNLKPTISTCKFNLFDKATANQFNTATDDIPVRITKDGTVWFKGIARPSYKTVVKAGMKVFVVEVTDLGYYLRKKINSNIEYVNYTLCDPTNKAASLLHQLFYLAGITDADIDFTAISKTIDYFAVEIKDRISYEKKIKEMLWEYGYGYYVSKTGLFKIYDLFPTSLTPTAITDSNLLDNLTYKKVEERYEMVRVTFYPHITKNGIIVYSNNEGADGDNKCNIALAAGDYYPANSNLYDSYLKYEVNGYDIIVVNNAVLDITQTGVTTDIFTPIYKRAQIRLSSDAGGTITKLDITGDAVLLDKNTRTDVIKTIVSGTEKIFDYTCKYLREKTDADRLAAGLADWYRYNDYTYKFGGEGYVLGGYYELTESVMGFTTKFRIVEIIEDEYGYQKITAEGVDAYTLSGTTAEQDSNQPAIQPENQYQDPINSHPTYKEIATTGFDKGGGTTTPTQVTILENRGEFKGSILKWDKQNNLRNPDKYQVQVTDCGIQSCGLSGLTDSTETGLSPSTTYYFKVNINGGGVTEYNITTASDTTYSAVIALMNTAVSGATFFLMNGDLYGRSDTFGATSTIALSAGTTGTDLFATLTGFSSFDTAVDGAGGWYSLQFDMTDWKDTLDDYTSWYTELLVHTVPLRVSGGIGKGRVLGYRVRRYTKEPIAGTWSSTAICIIRTVENGDIAKHIITANNVDTSFLNAVVANIRSYIQISDTAGFMGQTYDQRLNPSIGAKRAYLDQDEVTLSEYTATWTEWADKGFTQYSQDDAAYNMCSIKSLNGKVYGLIMRASNDDLVKLNLVSIDKSGGQTFSSYGTFTTNAIYTNTSFHPDILKLSQYKFIALWTKYDTVNSVIEQLYGTVFSWDGYNPSSITMLQTDLLINDYKGGDTPRVFYIGSALLNDNKFLVIYKYTDSSTSFTTYARVVTVGEDGTLTKDAEVDTGYGNIVNQVYVNAFDSTHGIIGRPGDAPYGDTFSIDTSNNITLNAWSYSGDSSYTYYYHPDLIIDSTHVYIHTLVDEDPNGNHAYKFKYILGTYDASNNSLSLGSETLLHDLGTTLYYSSTYDSMGWLADGYYYKVHGRDSTNQIYFDIYLANTTTYTVSLIHSGYMTIGDTVDYIYHSAPLSDYGIVAIAANTTPSPDQGGIQVSQPTLTWITQLRIGGDDDGSPRISGDGTNINLKPASGGRIIFDGATDLRYYYTNSGLSNGAQITTTSKTLTSYSKTFTAKANRIYKINMAVGVRGATDGGYCRYVAAYLNVNGSVVNTDLHGMNMNSSSEPSWYFVLRLSAILSGYNDGDTVNLSLAVKLSSYSSGDWYTYSPSVDNEGYIEILELPAVDSLV